MISELSHARTHALEFRGGTALMWEIRGITYPPPYRDAGEVHELRNIGSRVYRNVLVEVK